MNEEQSQRVERRQRLSMRGLELKAALWNCCTKVGKATKIRMWEAERRERERERGGGRERERERLSLIHISEPTRRS